MGDTGVLSRFRAIFRANPVTDEFGDIETDLENNLDQLQKAKEALEHTLSKVREARARLEKQPGAVAGAMNSYGRQSQAVAESGSEEPGRTLVAVQQEAEGRQSEARPRIADLDRQMNRLKQGQADVERTIALLRSHEKALKSAHSTAQMQADVRQALVGMPEYLADMGHVIYDAQALIREIPSWAIEWQTV
jgi:phage shock protein A